MKRWLPALALGVDDRLRLRFGERARRGGVQDAPAQESRPDARRRLRHGREGGEGLEKDAVPAQISTTSLGPLQPNGSAASWNIQFYSKEADSHVAMNVFRGSMTCWADKGPAGRIPDLKPDFFKDGAALYGIAKKEGGDFIAKGFNVDLGSSAAPSNNHAMWYLNFSKQNERNAPLTIVVDANTGAVEKVLKD